MSYKRATLISDDNPNVKLRIAIGDDGDVYMKVMLGEASSEVVHLGKKGSTNEEIRNLLSDIVDSKNCDIPIGTVIVMNGQKYVCTKAEEGCTGCVFEPSGIKCPDCYCLGDDRADGFDVKFKRKK